MKRNISTTISLLSFSLVIISGCSKYLDKKPDATLATLSTLEEFQAFLDDYGILNTSMQYFNDVMSDNYYMTSASWTGMDDVSREVYRWNKIDIPQNLVWKYKPILYTNIVIDELPDAKDAASNKEKYTEILGSALFFRGFHHFSLAQIFSYPYNKDSKETDLGIPLRLTSDYNETSTRATVAQTYAQIIKDLKESATLLPPTNPIKTRPSKAAAYGTLARLYLSIEEYDSAWIYANECLSIYDSLMDFNTPDAVNFAGASASAPIKRFNKEIIFHARSGTTSPLLTSRAKIDSTLYSLYNTIDWRKTVYFRANTGANAGTYAFKGDYDGAGTNSGYSYVGIVTDEQYLIRAECKARKGELQAALADLNKLLSKRIKTADFVPLDILDQQQLIDIIITERYKELFFRSTRWMDIKRLSKDPQRTKIPKRIIDNQAYELRPVVSQYSLQIPSSVIQLSGMPQNP